MAKPLHTSRTFSQFTAHLEIYVHLTHIFSTSLNQAILLETNRSLKQHLVVLINDLYKLKLQIHPGFSRHLSRHILCVKLSVKSSRCLNLFLSSLHCFFVFFVFGDQALSFIYLLTFYRFSFIHISFLLDYLLFRDSVLSTF